MQWSRIWRQRTDTGPITTIIDGIRHAYRHADGRNLCAESTKHDRRRKAHFARLFRPKQPVACITQTRHDIGVFVQMRIERRDIDFHMRMRFLECLYTFGSCHQC